MKASQSSALLTLFTSYIRGSAGYTLPQNAPFPLLRSSAINVTRAGFLYGDAVAGGPFYPTGKLGLAKVAVDVAAEQSEALPEQVLIDTDAAAANASSAEVRVHYTPLDDIYRMLILSTLICSFKA